MLKKIIIIKTYIKERQAHSRLSLSESAQCKEIFRLASVVLDVTLASDMSDKICAEYMLLTVATI